MSTEMESWIGESQSRVDAMLADVENVEQGIAESFEIREESIEKLRNSKSLDEIARIKDSVFSAVQEEMPRLHAQDQQDIARVMAALEDVFASLNLKLDSFEDLNENEQSIVLAAREAKADLERQLQSLTGRIPSLESAVDAARNSSNGFLWHRSWTGAKQAEVDAAQSELDGARQRRGRVQQDLTKSDDRIAEAEAEAESRRRARLESADLEATAQHFRNVSLRAIDLLSKREQQIDKEAQNLGEVVKANTEKRQFFAKAVDARQEELGRYETELETEKSALNDLANGTEEYTRQQAVVEAVELKVLETKGKLNIALDQRQVFQEWVERQRIGMTAAITLRDNLRLLIGRLQRTTEQRADLLTARVEAAKAATTAQAGTQIHNVGSDFDERATKFMAQAAVSIERANTEIIESFPDRMETLLAVEDGMTEAQIEMHKSIMEHIERVKENYGIRSYDKEDFRRRHSGDDPTPATPVDDEAVANWA